MTPMHNAISISFISALASGFDELVAVRVEAMRESLVRIGRFDRERARERFRSGFSPQHTRHILLDGGRVGFVVIKPQEDHLLLDHLYIRPCFQGRGIGAAVLESIFKEADTAGRPIRVGALRESASNRFYRRHGFEKIAESEWDIYYIRVPIPSV